MRVRAEGIGPRLRFKAPAIRPFWGLGAKDKDFGLRFGVWVKGEKVRDPGFLRPWPHCHAALRKYMGRQRIGCVGIHRDMMCVEVDTQGISVFRAVHCVLCFYHQ